MSHVACVETEVGDLDRLERAAQLVGLRLVRGQRTHRWYGRWLNDWHSDRAASKKGRDPKTFGTCDHALVIADQPGAYEIGVTARPDGTFDLIYDAYDGRLERVAGVDLEKLQSAYLAVTAEEVATSEGHSVECVAVEGGYDVTVYV